MLKTTLQAVHYEEDPRWGPGAKNPWNNMFGNYCSISRLNAFVVDQLWAGCRGFGLLDSLLSGRGPMVHLKQVHFYILTLFVHVGILIFFF